MARLETSRPVAFRGLNQSGFERRVLGQAHREPEGAADTRRALGTRLAAHQAGQLARDRQSEPGAAVLARRRAIGLLELAEQPGQHIRRDTFAGIGYLEAQHHVIHVVGQHLEAQRDAAALGELEGIGRVVEHALLQPRQIAEQVARHSVDFAEQLQTLAARPLFEH